MTVRPAPTADLRAPLIAAGVFLVALCLRPAITSVGPVLPQVGADLGFGEGTLGLLGALPLLAFAAVSPLVHRVAARTGPERAVLGALLLLAAGALVRSCAGTAGLWIGTVVIGCAITVGNVLIPAIIKRDHGANVSRTTAGYSAFISGAAAVASAVSVPLAAVGGWRLALGIWAVQALVVACAWLPRLRARPRPVPAAGPADGPAAASVWRRPAAWLLTAFMGLQSTIFYIMVTWLPTIETAGGVPAGTAGVHLFVYQGTGILGGLAIPILMHRRADQTAAALTASAPMILAVAGLLTAPSLVLLWAVLAGLGSGASLVMALSLIGLRGRTPGETTRLSGMVQSLGYLLAAAGPAAAGHLAEQTGAWRAPLLLLGALAVLQTAVAAAVGAERPRREPRPGPVPAAAGGGESVEG